MRTTVTHPADTDGDPEMAAFAAMLERIVAAALERDAEAARSSRSRRGGLSLVPS